MLKVQKDVQDFHELFDAVIGEHPEIRRADLRCALIKEESKELRKALEDGDIVEAIDGMCDLIYVTVGTAVEMGIDLEPFWDAVHAANLAKHGGHGEREDGKIKRPKGWTPPDIAGILLTQKTRVEAGQRP